MNFLKFFFFSDFWNAETLSVFWKTWNIPVHRWAVRHVYKPMVSFGFSKMSASVAVFFISAFFHEYLVKFIIFIWFYITLYMCTYLFAWLRYRSQSRYLCSAYGLFMEWYLKFLWALLRTKFSKEVALEI